MTEKPTALTVIPANIPEALKGLPQWVCWKYAWKEGKEDKPGKWTKPPFEPNGNFAKSTDSKTYSEFGEALAAYQEEESGFDGIGFVLTPIDPFVGIDIDHCFVDGIVTDEAQGIINELDSYTERSPSGAGIRIFVTGTIPKAVKKDQIEMYAQGRYVTVTGQKWPL